jgi:hypothetical protein
MVDRFIDDDGEQDFFDHSTPPITLAVDEAGVYLGIGTPSGVNDLTIARFTDADVLYSPIVFTTPRFKYSVFNQ